MYRISKKPRGWIVEKQIFKYKFLGLHFYKVWRPFIKTRQEAREKAIEKANEIYNLKQ